MTYTQETLTSLSNEELDALLANTLWSGKASEWYASHWPLSTSWNGFGETVSRMLELGWSYDIDATAPEIGIDVTFHPKNPAFKAKGTAFTLPRAAAIAAILAAQGAS